MSIVDNADAVLSAFGTELDRTLTREQWEILWAIELDTIRYVRRDHRGQRNIAAWSPARPIKNEFGSLRTFLGDKDVSAMCHELWKRYMINGVNQGPPYLLSNRGRECRDARTP